MLEILKQFEIYVAFEKALEERKKIFQISYQYL